MSLSVLCPVLLAGPLLASPPGPAVTFEVTVTAGKQAYEHTPVCVPLSVPKALAKVTDLPLQWTSGGQVMAGQLTAPGITTEHIKPSGPGLVRRDLHFLLDQMKPGASVTLLCKVSAAQTQGGARERFGWVESREGYTELVLSGGQPPRRAVARYMHRPYDKTSKEARDQTYKVFHHLFDPAGGRLVTNGGYTDRPIRDEKKLLYPHHRGLMYAFNHISYAGVKQADTWHAQPGDSHEEHVAFLGVAAGPVLARERVLIEWHGPKNDVFAKEERELTIYNVPGGTLVDFVSRLKTADGPVKLDGDPQHAGFQFRAANDVAEKTEKQTYFLRPDGKGKLDETRNWDPKTGQGPVNLPWDAMSFVLDGKRYTVAYLNNPANPGEQRYSERAYGRIGCYFAYDLTQEHPLVVRYRVCLQQGEMTVPQVQALSREFVTLPQVAVK
jgi:hypothetical protein